MTVEFEELDFQETPLGDISLRRRSELRLAGKIVYEVKLGDEFLMSSLFTDAEIQLAKLGLAALEGSDLDIVVGGLGLGYTAAAVLEDPSVASLMVVEVMEAVIDWHRRGLVPLGKKLVSDPRCTLVHADFFALAAASAGGFPIGAASTAVPDAVLPPPSLESGADLTSASDRHGWRECNRIAGAIPALQADAAAPVRLVHAVLLDIDHSPSHWLNPGNSAFYTAPALRKLADKLHPGGIFGLWSNDPPDADFTSLLDAVFQSSESHIVTFANPYTGGESSSTIYLARKSEVG
jgi:hypothetical protein